METPAPSREIAWSMPCFVKPSIAFLIALTACGAAVVAAVVSVASAAVPRPKVVTVTVIGGNAYSAAPPVAPNAALTLAKSAVAFGIGPTFLRIAKMY